MQDRTTIAAMALQGLLANPNHGDVSYADLSDMAVAHADTLLSSLNQSAVASTESVKDGSAPTLRELGLPGRAAAPLERLEVVTLAQLAVQSRDDIAGVKGVSKQSVEFMDKLLEDNGLTWEWTQGEPETPSEEGEEEMEDVL